MKVPLGRVLINFVFPAVVLVSKAYFLWICPYLGTGLSSTYNQYLKDIPCNSRWGNCSLINSTNCMCTIGPYTSTLICLVPFFFFVACTLATNRATHPAKSKAFGHLATGWEERKNSWESQLAGYNRGCTKQVVWHWAKSSLITTHFWACSLVTVAVVVVWVSESVCINTALCELEIWREKEDIDLLPCVYSTLKSYWTLRHCLELSWYIKECFFSSLSNVEIQML